jgi:hypothetical protein
VEEILEWNRFTSHSIRRCAIQFLLQMMRFVNPTSEDPQF